MARDPGNRPWAKPALSALVVVVLASLIWANREELPATARALRTADLGWLAIGGGVLLLWWLDWTMLYVTSRQVTRAGTLAETPRLVPVTMAAIALNLGVKSGGLAGLAVFLADGRRRGVPAGRVSGGYLLAAMLAEIAFVVTLAAAMVLTWWDGRLTRVELLAVVAFVCTLAIRVAALVAALRSREAVRKLWSLPSRGLAWIRRRPVAEVDPTVPDELYEASLLLRDRPGRALPALGFAIGVDVLGAAMLWAALAAVGGGDRPVVALITYAVSALFGIVGFMPGGLGFVEVGVAAVLVSFGVALPVAAAAVVVFRLWEFWMPLVVGGIAASWLRQGAADTAAS